MNRWMLPLALALSLGLGCARPPRPAYAFDNQPGGWELADHSLAQGQREDRYSHAVHSEALEFFEVPRPAPASSSTEFAALAPASRAVPPLATPTGAPRALGDEELAGAPGYWIEQHGRDGDAMLNGAAFVVPNGRRYFVVRMSSREDDVEQLQGWVRDLVIRNVRFPAAIH